MSRKLPSYTYVDESTAPFIFVRDTFLVTCTIVIRNTFRIGAHAIEAFRPAIEHREKATLAGQTISGRAAFCGNTRIRGDRITAGTRDEAANACTAIAAVVVYRTAGLQAIFARSAKGACTTALITKLRE